MRVVYSWYETKGPMVWPMLVTTGDAKNQIQPKYIMGVYSIPTEGYVFIDRRASPAKQSCNRLIFNIGCDPHHGRPAIHAVQYVEGLNPQMPFRRHGLDGGPGVKDPVGLGREFGVIPSQ